MVDSKLFNIPLSPPRSPYMNQFQSDSAVSSWQDQPKLESTSNANNGDMALIHAPMPHLDLDKPRLLSHKSYPYPLTTSGTNLHQPDTPPLNSAEVSPNDNQVEGLGISNLPEPSNSELATITFGGSAPASPISNLTPPSPIKDHNHHHHEHHDLHDQFDHPDHHDLHDHHDHHDLDQQHDLNGLDLDMDDPEEHNDKPMTAAEIRAQKRKMKRFRLTHNQTRFLMSEFARQAHPDAAHRERLAREIPGLSPRQVQVWFQNRRAKLKRLTSDDRERMMRSRALPDDFDMTQALHSPFGTPHGVGNGMGAPPNYQPQFPEGNMIRPLSLDTLRVRDGSHMSPSGMSPFSGYNFTPPQSVTDTLSPVSPSGGDSPFSTYSPTLGESPRRSNPFAPGSSNSTFTSHPQIPRLQMHDRSMGRSRSESITSPLRTSMSYGGPDHPTGLSTPPLGNDSNGSNGMVPYGLGYSYSTIPGFQATSNSRIRSFSNNFPRKIEMGGSNNSYGASRSGGPPQTATFSPYTSSPMTTNSFSMMGAPHGVTSFPTNNYMRQDGSPTETFPGVDSLLGDDSSNHHDDNDNNDGNTSSFTNF